MDRKKGLTMKENKRIVMLRCAVLAAGVIMIAIGIGRGEPAEIMTKAVKVCLECIGIG